MSPLAIELLRRHQASPTFRFYGDSLNTGDMIHQHGFNALDEAYTELEQLGYVERGTHVSHGGTPKPNYKITPAGLDAQAV
jgi:hypothetical protein